MLWDNLTSAEAEFTQHVLQTLKNEPWAAQLVRTINDAGGITQANMPFLSKLALLTPCTGAGLNLITSTRPA
jgi:hypothetical protein